MANLFIFTLLFLTACAASPFQRHYYDYTKGAPPSLDVSEAQPSLYHGIEPQDDSQAMLENGYKIVGRSDFNAGPVDENGAIEQARRVGATVVYLYSKYSHTATGVVPLIVPQNQTSNTDASGVIYGTGGQSSFSGSASTTTTSTRTEFKSYTVPRYDYLATYWAKGKPPVLGVIVDDLNSEQRARLGTNKGVQVIAVIKGSPAFRDDILRGDVIRRIGQTEILESENFRGFMAKLSGQKVTVELYRGNTRIEKLIQLNDQR